MTRQSIAVVLATLALGLATGIAPAPAQGSVMIATPGAYLTPTYGQPATVALVGGELTFVNLDINRHDVQAVSAVAPDQCTSPSPAICPAGTPTWCRPPDPTKVWTLTGGTNDLPFPPGTCPMLWSRLIGVGATTPVLGLEYVTSGQTYEFLCSIHRLMRGTLIAL
jgi:plastocyanin